MVSLKFRLQGREFIATAKSTIDPKEVVFDLEKKILSIASEQDVTIPEHNKRYLISRICKALILQYPIKGESKALELNPEEIVE